VSANKAREILGRLIDRRERHPDRTREPRVSVPELPPSAADRDAFNCVLADAERAGAIILVKGRGERRHLVDGIRLKDPALLYRFLERVPDIELAKAAGEFLHRETTPRQAEALSARDWIADAWLHGQRPFNLGRDRPAYAVEFINALDAALARDPMDRRDLRTYSGQETGDSKLIERHASRIVAFLKQVGQLDPTLSDDDAMASLGLEKFPQPLLVSGPATVAGIDLSGLVYAGVAPEQAALLEPSVPIRSVLTIENFASFNRHVREAKQAGDIVVYTGGFPSRAVIAAVVAISHWPGVHRIHHWGDVDEGGLLIALNLASAVKIPLVPHLMTPELARRNGTPKKVARPIDLPLDHPWRPLAMFLQSDEARFLEQERIDPRPTCMAGQPHD
jgi:Uncharacterized protein conserved in bacteria C-term(DUF2220)